MDQSFLETIGFISPVMSKFAAIASNSNPDPLLSALIAPSIFEFLTSLSSKHPREMDRLDADYNFSRTLKAATESDSDDILMHAFLLIGGIIRTRDGLFWLDLNVPSAIFEMATAARFSMGRVKSAALSAFGSLLQDDTKYPASDLDVISGKLFESIGGLNGVIAIAQKSIEKHDIVSSYAILNNLLRFSWGARTLQDSGIAISFFFSPPKGEKEKSLRDALLTTVLEQPNVEATLTPDLVKRFHTLLHDKSVPAPTVAYMEL
ncbi:hypothetical protein BC829DRAFT_7114 [Chytridium lagenaria]|nr:hypothetical protein BC829DRAFT_7114 [Chytridium lagenaria]